MKSIYWLSRIKILQEEYPRERVRNPSFRERWMSIYVISLNLIRRAGRSVGDRYLGMVEAAGSIPARSISYYLFFDKIKSEDLENSQIKDE